MEKALADEPEEDSVEDGKEVTRSLRPGQKGFAERLMSKYGWSKGSGLGAEGTGIVNALSVKVDKRKKKSDAEGGGFREPAKGKIVGGQKSAAGKASEQGKFGAMSEVIKLRGMVDGMDLDQEVEGSGDGGLMQEIGEECGEKVCHDTIPNLLEILANLAVRSCRESVHSSTRRIPGHCLRQIY